MPVHKSSGVATGWTGVDIPDPLSLEVAPEIVVRIRRVFTAGRGRGRSPPPDPRYRLALAMSVHPTYFDLATPLHGRPSTDHEVWLQLNSSAARVDDGLVYQRGLVIAVEVGEGSVPVVRDADANGCVELLEAGRSGRPAAAAARVVQLLDVLYLLLRLHPAVLEPDLDLSLGEAERVRDLDAPLAREVAVELELLLQLQRLVA